MDLSKRVFGSNIDPKIQKYLSDLQRGGFDVEYSALSPINYKTSDYQTYLGNRTTYARMWTAVNVVEVSNIDNEPIGSGENSVYIINDNEISSYIPDEFDPVGELDDDTYLKPTAGITDVSSRAEGSLGALRRTTVKFIVHNKKDFDRIFLPFFLKPGSFVFVDFGWSDEKMNLYDPNAFINNTDLELGDFYEQIYNNDDLIKSGLRSTLGGRVTKYDVNVNQNQSFECTLEFVSQNYQLLESEVSEDNDLKFIFTNVLEDLLLLKYINTSEKGAQVVGNELKQSYLWKEESRESRSERIKQFLDGFADFNTEKIIDDYSKRVGVFYQNISKQKSTNLQAMEGLYVSFAVFEDDFLNNYVAYWTDKDGTQVTQNKTANLPKFSSQNTYVRWNENLNEMMKIKPRSIDKPLSFLYPDSWNAKETSNRYKPSPDIYVNEAGQNDFPGNANITDYDIKKQRIPLRELFIRTSIIIEAFNTSTSVSDALEKIFDHIFEDSGNLINIRLMKNNDFESSLTFHDVNIETIEKKTDETFVFDITSGNTIVQNVDLKFETPKSGLSSMIAIGNLSEPELFDEFQLMRFNILNAIQTTSETNKVQVRHLPVIGEKPQNTLNYDVDVSKVIGTYTSFSPKMQTSFNSGKSFESKYKTYQEDRAEYFKDQDKEIPEDAKSGKTQTNLRGDKRYVVTANSERDIELLKARMYTFGGSGENAIAPVLPISLTLEVYGNNFLNIGDYFTINFLPETFKDRVYFQIVGVDHSISTGNWKTTYNTVMRPYSTKKYFQYGMSKGKDLASLARVTFSGVFLEEIQNQFMVESGVINEHQQNMAERFELLKGGSGTFDEDGPNETYFKSFLVHYDVFKNEDKANKRKKETTFISTSAKKPFVETPGQLVWLMAVSNQVFKAIDWEEWDKSLGQISSNKKLKAKILAAGDFINDNIAMERLSIPGNIFVAHQFYKGPGGEGLGDSFNDFVNTISGHGGFFNGLKAAFGFTPEDETKARKELNDRIEKFVDIQGSFLDSLGEPIFESSTIPERNKNGSGVKFLLKIDFQLEKISYDENQLSNQFKILKFENNDDCKYFSVIQLPSKYLISGITMKKLAENIFREYSILKSAFLEKIEAQIEKVLKAEEAKADKQRKTEQKYGENLSDDMEIGGA